jgi:hypothetical protein
VRNVDFVKNPQKKKPRQVTGPIRRRAAPDDGIAFAFPAKKKRKNILKPRGAAIARTMDVDTHTQDETLMRHELGLS